jgi:hypothetical protein
MDLVPANDWGSKTHSTDLSNPLRDEIEYDTKYAAQGRKARFVDGKMTWLGDDGLPGEDGPKGQYAFIRRGSIYELFRKEEDVEEGREGVGKTDKASKLSPVSSPCRG